MFAIAVPFAMVLACALARQPVTSLSPEVRALEPGGNVDPELYRDIIMSPYEPHYVQYDDSPRVYSFTHQDVLSLPGQMSPEDLLSKEIALLSNWGHMEPMRRDPYSLLMDYNQDQPSTLLTRLLGLERDYNKYSQTSKKLSSNIDSTHDKVVDEVEAPEVQRKAEAEIDLETLEKKERKKNFALTPLDEGYFDVMETPEPEVVPVTSQLMEPRKTRQNPNWSRSKTLIDGNLDELRVGVANKVYRIPVSLLPTNLQLLRISQAKDHTESTDGATGSTVRPHHIHIIETARPKQVESLVGTAFMAAVGAAVSMALVGLVFGWYTISKKAKAAADVDYPAYGVTGPTVDPSGDRKLAHSAHMYHYQHQKQQILAMERNGLGHNGSESDPESEDDNEEGDYTVYECPGLATTGNMEVKNPLFNEEPTPATPGISDVVPETKDN